MVQINLEKMQREEVHFLKRIKDCCKQNKILPGDRKQNAKLLLVIGEPGGIPISKSKSDAKVYLKKKIF